MREPNGLSGPTHNLLRSSANTDLLGAYSIEGSYVHYDSNDTTGHDRTEVDFSGHILSDLDTSATGDTYRTLRDPKCYLREDVALS